MKKLLGFDSKNFIKKAYLKPFFVIFLMSIYVVFYNCLNIESVIQKVIGIIVTFLISLVFVWNFGLFDYERIRLKCQIKNIRNRHIRHEYEKND